MPPPEKLPSDFGQELLLDTLRAIAGIPMEVGRLHGDVAALRGDIEELREQQTEHDEAQRREISALRADLQARAQNRFQMTLALIGAAAVVFAAIVTALVTILTAHG